MSLSLGKKVQPRECQWPLHENSSFENYEGDRNERKFVLGEKELRTLREQKSLFGESRIVHPRDLFYFFSSIDTVFSSFFMYILPLYICSSEKILRHLSNQRCSKVNSEEFSILSITTYSFWISKNLCGQGIGKNKTCSTCKRVKKWTNEEMHRRKDFDKFQVAEWDRNNHLPLRIIEPTISLIMRVSRIPRKREQIGGSEKVIFPLFTPWISSMRGRETS